MKNLIEWIKSNPIVTACAAISLVGLLVIGYFYVIVAPNYSAAKSDELKQQINRQQALLNIPVPLPNVDPNAPPDTYQVVVNQTVINDVQKIYNQIQTQYESILGNARTKNDQHHRQFLLGRGQIWPDKNPALNFDLYVQAASDYKDHFTAVFDKDNRSNPWNMPHIVASGPPTTAELETILAQSAFDYISSVGAQSANELTQSQADQLFAEQRMKLMQALNLRARSINLYVTLPPEEDRFAPKEDASGPGAPAPVAAPASPFGRPAGVGAVQTDKTAGYPFHIEPWANADQPPTPDQLWEGQVQVWIMRDIIRTIHQVNKVGQTVPTTGPDGVTRDEFATVVNSPIKRLLNLKTLRGYVGLHNTGAVMDDGADFGTNAPAGGQPFDAGRVGGGATASTPSIYPTPPAELIETLKPKEVTVDAAEHFGITPTGRVSNSVFDVRHTQLTIDIEAARIPAFIEALNQANFMTVIKLKVTDLDEYELLQEGYVYGYEDVVRAELIIESLWFRNWTEELMPKIVKEKLLIILPEVDPNSQPLGQPDF